MTINWPHRSKFTYISGADAGFLKGGVQLISLGIQAKRGGPGSPALGLMLKPMYIVGQKGGPDPRTPPPHSSTAFRTCDWLLLAR